MIAGIVLDGWKLDIFTRHLQDGGFSFTNKGAMTKGTIVLHVETESAEALRPVIEAANNEANKRKMN